jgi:hypothetical protein
LSEVIIGPLSYKNYLELSYICPTTTTKVIVVTRKDKASAAGVLEAEDEVISPVLDADTFIFFTFSSKNGKKGSGTHSP